ncbi:MAG: hypothetical protein U0271_21230 [Polyangiaceae bacterium]
MSRRWLELSCPLLVAACGAPAREPCAQTSETTALTASASAPTNGKSLGRVVRLSPDPRHEVIRTRIDWSTNESMPTRWRLPVGGAVRVVTPATGVKLDAQAGELTLEPGKVLELEITPNTSATRGGCPLLVTPDKAVFCGDAVLPIPLGGADMKVDTLVVVAPDHDLLRHSASSFGLEEEVRATIDFDDLARAAYLFGDLGHAELEVQEGRDHAAWMGYFPFDPRWVAAESAGARTGVDKWFRITRSREEPSVALLFVNLPRDGEPAALLPIFRGALVRTDLSSPWTARSRIELARLFVQRDLAGIDVVPSSEGRFFSEGFAHAMALVILKDMGLVSRAEAVQEINSWLAEEALSPLAGRGLADLGALANTTTPDPQSIEARRLIAVRGALAGLSLNDPNGEGLHGFAARLLAGGPRELDRVALFDVAAASTKGPRALDVRDKLASGAVIPLQATDLDTCVGLSDHKLYAFELGFTQRREASSERARVDTVTTGSAAEKAGARAGDEIESLSYSPDQSEVPVRLRVSRKGQSVELSYLPRGRMGQGKLMSVTSRKGVCEE